MNLIEVITVALSGSLNDLNSRIEPVVASTGAGVSTESSSMMCILQSTPRSPVFSNDGDFLIGGIFSIHYKLYTVVYNYTTKPEPSRCTGR